MATEPLDDESILTDDLIGFAKTLQAATAAMVKDRANRGSGPFRPEALQVIADQLDRKAQQVAGWAAQRRGSCRHPPSGSLH